MVEHSNHQPLTSKQHAHSDNRQTMVGHSNHSPSSGVRTLLDEYNSMVSGWWFECPTIDCQSSECTCCSMVSGWWLNVQPSTVDHQIERLLECTHMNHQLASNLLGHHYNVFMHYTPFIPAWGVLTITDCMTTKISAI